jgi:hypothetical protein
VAPSPASPFNVPQPNLSMFGIGAGDALANNPPSDRPGNADQSGVESYPVAPGRRTTMQRLSTEAGANPGPVVGGDALAFAPADQPPGTQPQRRGPGRGFDAVEGTARDPLRNKTFDLNHAHTVPKLR